MKSSADTRGVGGGRARGDPLPDNEHELRSGREIDRKI